MAPPVDLVNAQNATLSELSKNIEHSYSTDDRKTMYQNTIVRGNNYYIFLLFCFYYALCAIVAFVLYRFAAYSTRIKVLILLAFLIYPFVIGMIELKIYNILAFFKALITSTIYTRSSMPFPKPPPSPGIPSNLLTANINTYPTRLNVSDNEYKVKFYKHCNYEGDEWTLGIGDYPNSDKVGPTANDIISSVKVPAGMKVTLYQHSDYTGKSLELTGDAGCLANKLFDFNDITSSIKITL